MSHQGMRLVGATAPPYGAAMATLALLALVPLVGVAIPLVLTGGGLLFGYLCARDAEGSTTHGR